MAQKDYKLEIILALLKKEDHVRAIAKGLDINHMMISRKVKELMKENVLDYRQEGKNKVFFIKKSIEARSYVLIAENYKLKKIMNKYPLLRNAVNKMQEDKKIKLAILFGSYAKETAKEDSDIDIYIETENIKFKKELSLLDSKLSITIGKYDAENNLMKEIKKNHAIIKGAEEYYEKEQFFN